MVLLSFVLSVTATEFLRGRLRGQSRAECASCWTPFVNAHVRGWRIINRNYVGGTAWLLSKKNRNKSPWVRFIFRNLFMETLRICDQGLQHRQFLKLFSSCFCHAKTFLDGKKWDALILTEMHVWTSALLKKWTALCRWVWASIHT